MVISFTIFNGMFFNFRQINLFDKNYNFKSGIHTFYLYSNSSNAKMISYDIEGEKDKVKINSFNIKGESLFLPFQNGQSAVNEYISSLLTRFNAKIQIIESGDFGDGKYYYSKAIPNYVIIKGKRVNLHVVKSKMGVTVGTPIIFGSF